MKHIEEVLRTVIKIMEWNADDKKFKDCEIA